MLTDTQRRLPLWFCVRTKTGRETGAVKTVAQVPLSEGAFTGGMETYFPRIRTRMAVGGPLRVVIKPLFPGYFFARFVWESASRFVLSRRNVTGIVHFGEHPAVVADGVIEELKTCGMRTEEAEIFDPMSGLELGQRVVIRSGPFRGMEGEVVMRLSDRKRVALLMDHLQSQARLTIGHDQLRPVF